MGERFEVSPLWCFVGDQRVRFLNLLSALSPGGSERQASVTLGFGVGPSGVYVHDCWSKENVLRVGPIQNRTILSHRTSQQNATQRRGGRGPRMRFLIPSAHAEGVLLRENALLDFRGVPLTTCLGETNDLL